MNKTFFRLSESTLKSGLLQLNPHLAQEFKHVTDTFTTLVKTASERQYEVDDENVEGGEHPANGTTISNQRLSESTPPEPEPHHVGWGYAVMSSTTKDGSAPQPQTQSENYFSNLSSSFGQPDSTTTSVIRRRQFTDGDVIDQPRLSQTSQLITQQASHLPFGLVDMIHQRDTNYSPQYPHIYPVTIPTPAGTPPSVRLNTPPLPLPNTLTTKTLPPIVTYSFEEATFARRLTRATLETGFQLLSTANVRPAALSYVFKLSLPFMDLEQLREKFKIMLAKDVKEDMDWWETPFIHLGGAGTHYPRQDASGNTIVVKNCWNIRQIGPLEKRMVRLQSVEDGRFEDLEGIDLTGFDGEWFDAFDVQGYLEEQYACKLDPKSSFAECLVDDEESEPPQTGSNNFLPYDGLTRRSSGNDTDSDSASLTHSTTTSSNSSSTSITPPFNNVYNLPDPTFGLDMGFSQAPNFPADLSKGGNFDLSLDQTLGLDLAPGFDYGFTNSHTWSGPSPLALDMMGVQEEPISVVKQKRKKSAWLDVSMLMNGKFTKIRTYIYIYDLYNVLRD